MSMKAAIKILVIDDDSAIRASVQDALEFEGYQTMAAKNGKEGLDCARVSTPDLILLDMMMPIMNGQEFLEAWRMDKDISNIPIIVFSISKLEGRLDERVKKLNKPVDLDVLFNEISDSLGKQSI